MKKIYSIVLILSLLFTLTSCVKTEWEDITPELFYNLRMEDFNKETGEIKFSFLLYLSQEELVEFKDNYTVQFRLYLNIDYIDYSTFSKDVIGGIPAEFDFDKPDGSTYYVTVNISDKIQNLDDVQIQDFEIQRSEFRVKVSMNALIDSLPEEQRDYFKAQIIASIFATFLYLLIVVPMGIIVNRKITKKYRG